MARAPISLGSPFSAAGLGPNIARDGKGKKVKREIDSEGYDPRYSIL